MDTTWPYVYVASIWLYKYKLSCVLDLLRSMIVNNLAIITLNCLSGNYINHYIHLGIFRSEYSFLSAGKSGE